MKNKIYRWKLSEPVTFKQRVIKFIIPYAGLFENLVSILTFSNYGASVELELYALLLKFQLEEQRKIEKQIEAEDEE